MTAELSTYLQGSNPVFICGMPKSGTTLLLALLDSHPQILAFPEETKFLQRIVTDRSNLSFSYLFERTDVRYLAEAMVADEAGVRDYQNFDAASFRVAAKNYRSSRAEQGEHARSARLLLESIVAAYGVTLGRKAPKLWVEKTPLNEVGLGDAFDFWPGAKAIYVVRDPRDVFYSYNRKRQERATEEMSLDSFEQMILSSLRGWSRAVRKFPLQCCLVRYEDLVTAPEQEMRRIAAFLRVPFVVKMLRPTRMGGKWGGNSMHRGDSFRISAQSVGVFEQMEPNAIKAIEAISTAMMERFGYATYEAPVAAPADL